MLMVGMEIQPDHRSGLPFAGILQVRDCNCFSDGVVRSINSVVRHVASFVRKTALSKFGIHVYNIKRITVAGTSGHINEETD